MRYIPFGNIKVGASAKARIWTILQNGQLTEGKLTEEFEKLFAKQFGWKHAIATSSGTTAGEVVWSAIREDQKCYPHSCQGSVFQYRGFVATPACAYVATATSVYAAGMEPLFVDIGLDTLNISPHILTGILTRAASVKLNIRAIQFVATMGHPQRLNQLLKFKDDYGFALVADLCEGHGIDASSYCDAAIYSLYPAHLVVGVEGGVICTDNDLLANLCRSIKRHGRPVGSNYFDFQRLGFNAKWSDLHAAIALESLASFDERFKYRRHIRALLVDALSKFENDLILYRDSPDGIIAPHAFPIVLRDEHAEIKSLYDHLQANGIECKTLFGSLPTQHKAFEFLGHRLGEFPVAERIGRTGLHFGCHESMTEDDVKYIANVIEDYFSHELHSRR